MDDLHHLSPLALAAMASATDALVKGKGGVFLIVPKP